MPNFSNFAKGNSNDSERSGSVLRKNESSVNGGFRMNQLWESDFKKCRSRSDFERYIEKYGRYTDNPFISESKSRIQKLERIEQSKRAESASNGTKVSHTTVADDSRTLKTVLATLGIFIMVILSGGMGVAIYNHINDDSTTHVEQEKEKTGSDDESKSNDENSFQDNQSGEATESLVTGGNMNVDEEKKIDSGDEKNREAVRTYEETIPIQEWKQCMNCLGGGRCPYCYGQGHMINQFGNDQDCPVCTDGRCGICAGRGGHYETRYETVTRYY